MERVSHQRKTLVLGLDGFDSKWVHLAPKFFQKAQLISIKDSPEDLLVRGWSKFLIGEDAYGFSALYNRPRLDGTFERTSSVNGKTNLASDKYLGKLDDVDLCFYPTLSPVLESEKSARISAPGGGVDPSGRVERKACSSEAVYKAVRNKRDWEVRISNFEKINLQEFLDILLQEMKESIEIFTDLTNTNGNRVSCLMLRFYESLLGQFAPELLKENKGKVPEVLRNALDKADAMLVDLLDSYKYENLIVVSDHGMTPLKGYVDLNQIIGTAISQSGDNQRLRGIVKKLNKHLPDKIYKNLLKIKKKVFKRSLVQISGFSPSDEQFAYRYVPGYFINDHRFASIVTKTEQKINELIEKLNTINHPAFARAIKSSDKFDQKTAYYPDVWVELNEGWYPENRPFKNQEFFSMEFDKMAALQCVDQYRATKAPVAFIAYSDTSVVLSNLEDVNRHLRGF